MKKVTRAVKLLCTSLGLILIGLTLFICKAHFYTFFGYIIIILIGSGGILFFISLGKFSSLLIKKIHGKDV